MVSRRYSGYLADDESLRGPQQAATSTTFSSSCRVSTSKGLQLEAVMECILRPLQVLRSPLEVPCHVPVSRIRRKWQRQQPGWKVKHLSNRRENYDWRSLLRPPSRCEFRNQETASSLSAFSTFAQGSDAKRKRHNHSFGESSYAVDEFNEFVDFLADEDVLDSLQNIVEDAVRKLQEVTTEDGEPLFDIQDDSCSSRGSETWSFSYSHRCGDSSSAHSRSKYYTTTPTATSSSDDDWERRYKGTGKHKAKDKLCLLDKFAARLQKPEKKKPGDVSAGFHAETMSEQSGDKYYFRQEHFHIWAKLAESFHRLQPPKKDYFSKFKEKVTPKQSFSAESLQKEVTNVLKRPIPSSIPLYFPGQHPFLALDFLEENKILAALQDIINQAVHKVLDATMPDGAPLFNIFDEKYLLRQFEYSFEEREEEEEEEEMKKSGTGTGTGSGAGSTEGDSKSEDEKLPDGTVRKKKKGKRKKKKGKAEKGEMVTEEAKGKQKYTPPLPTKFKRKSVVPEELLQKPKYVPPPLPKSKPRVSQQETLPKPKYVPPPLPKPKQKKQEVAQGEAEAQQPKQMTLTKHIITAKDIKRAHLQARPVPRQAIIEFLIENAAKLILYKYNYETLLSEKLGFISVPVTKVLLEIMFGFKRIKGSGIRLSSQIDWMKVYEEIYAPHPPKPTAPKLKGAEKKKTGKKVRDKKKAGEKKKTVLFKPEMSSGKVLITRAPVEQEAETSKTEARESTTEPEDTEVPEIIEILPPQFPEQAPENEKVAQDEVVEDTQEQPVSPEKSVDSPRRSVISTGSPRQSVVGSSTRLPSAHASPGGLSPTISPKQSTSSRRFSESHKGSVSILPEVEATEQPSGELLKETSFSRKTSIVAVSSRKSSTLLPKI